MIGQTISHYRIIEKLGEGGMGAVYKARDLSLNRLVALKFLPSHLTKNQSVRKRFTGEAQAASALDHPNLCTIHEINETEDGQLYICMAFYEGETLKEKIKDKKLEVNDALHYALQIAYGLQRAHEEGIIHRDIKPANIIVTDKGEAKIVDFGLAKLAGEKLTESVSTKGTIAYMAPEFIRGLPADHRADLWSLGIVLFEMLTGHLPFQSEFPEPMMYAIVNEKPQLLSRYMDHAPEALQAIIDKLLEKNPGMRYRNLDEFLSDLRKFKPELTESHNQVIRKKIKRVPQKKMTAIGFSLILLSGIFLLYNNIIKFTSVESKPIAVISFENQTGEDEYDYLQKAIPNLLISSLEQSGDLRVATWERLNDLLKQKGMQDVKIINPEMGFEICRMDGIETIVLGSYTRAGEVFALDIKVLDVKSKELLQSASSRGQGISSILTSQIDELSRSIFREMGVSAKTSLPTQPIAEVTTSSMEAYNYFIRGREEYEKRNIENSRQFLEKAVKLDTTFATAYSYLAVSYYMLDNRKAGNMSLQKAKLYINKATEKERLYIEARYAQHLERNNEKRFDLWHKITEKYPQEKRAQLDLAHFYYARRKLYAQAIERYQKVIELDPKFGLTYNMMALTYMEMGEYRQALKSFERYAAVNPGDANVFDSTGELYLRMGKLDQALAKYQEAIQVEPKYFYAYRTTAYIYALKEDYDQTMKWIDQYIQMASSDGIKARGHVYKAFYCFWLGSIEQSLKELERAASFYEAVKNVSGLSYIDWVKAWIYFYLGDTNIGREHFRDWYDFHMKFDPESTPVYKAEFCFYFGITDLGKDKINSAQDRLNELKKVLPDIGLENKDRIKHYYDIMNMEILLSKGSVEKVIRVAEELSVLQIPSIHPKSLISYNMPFLKLRDFSARAYLRIGDLDEAIIDYEKLCTFNPKNTERRLIHPVYYFRLAKLYEEKDQSDKAIENYEKFLDIWKNADKGLPEVMEAKERLSKSRKLSYFIDISG